MPSIHLDVPEALSQWMQQRIESGHYSNENDYLRDLIRRDMQIFAPEEASKIDAMLLQAVQENQYSPLTAQDTQSIRELIQP